MDREISGNIVKFREYIRELINLRREGKTVEDGYDLLQVLINEPETFPTDEAIIDEVLVIFTGGTQTLSTATSNVICYML